MARGSGQHPAPEPRNCQLQVQNEPLRKPLPQASSIQSTGPTSNPQEVWRILGFELYLTLECAGGLNFDLLWVGIFGFKPYP